MANIATTTELLKQKELQRRLQVSKWFIDVRIRRHPPGSAHPFPVERLGTQHRSRRRFDLDRVRAWLADEASGFAGRGSGPSSPA